jgi:hypothetical protein
VWCSAAWMVGSRESCFFGRRGSGRGCSLHFPPPSNDDRVSRVAIAYYYDAVVSYQAILGTNARRRLFECRPVKVAAFGEAVVHV